MFKEVSQEIAAQCWRDFNTKHLPMDPNLAEAFASRIDDLIKGLEEAWSIIEKAEDWKDGSFEWRDSARHWRDSVYRPILKKDIINEE